MTSTESVSPRPPVVTVIGVVTGATLACNLAYVVSSSASIPPLAVRARSSVKVEPSVTVSASAHAGVATASPSPAATTSDTCIDTAWEGPVCHSLPVTAAVAATSAETSVSTGRWWTLMAEVLVADLVVVVGASYIERTG